LKRIRSKLLDKTDGFQAFLERVRLIGS